MVCQSDGDAKVAAQAAYVSAFNDPPEKLLAALLRSDLGIDVHPQALRMWLRWRWSRVTPLAHSIHNA